MDEKKIDFFDDEEEGRESQPSQSSEQTPAEPEQHPPEPERPDEPPEDAQALPEEEPVPSQPEEQPYDIFKGLEEEPEVKTISPVKMGTIVLILAAVIWGIFYLINTDTGWVGQYKQNFSANIEKIDQSLRISETLQSVFHSEAGESADGKPIETEKPITRGLERETYMVPFENASSSQYAVTRDGVAVAKSNYLVVLNNKGKSQWETATSVVNPILKAEGDYILLAEKNGKKICLYDEQKQIYAVEAPNEILSASLSENGDVVLVTKREFYKGAVVVYNKEGQQIFAWNSGTDYVVSADISASSRRVAAALLNTDGRVKSSIQLFDIKKTESYATQEFEDTAICKVDFINETLNILGDNRIASMSVRGKVLWEQQYEGQSFVNYECDGDGNKIVLLDSNNIPELVVLNPSGGEKARVNAEEMPDYVDIQGRTILYNNSRIIVFGKYGAAEKYAASMDIQGLRIIDESTTLIVYNNSLEFVKM